jgi:putative endonuclease
MYTVYILYSEKSKKFYKGQTNNLPDRMRRHNARYEKATASGVPWKLIWATQKETRSDALKLEKKLKNLNRERTVAFIEKYS